MGGFQGYEQWEYRVILTLPINPNPDMAGS
jgi:hypothetical protein